MRRIALLLVLLIALPAAQALELAGVTLEETVKTHAYGTELKLNGAGVRQRLFMDIYVGALYLPQHARDAAAVLEQNGAKRMSLHFVYREIVAEKLVAAWNEGFEKNLPPEQFRALRPRIANFNGLFPTLRKGDRVDIDILPRAEKSATTQVWINGTLRGKVGGGDFARALLMIWLGEHPVDADLKRALLGEG
jgi:hypothetical protein